MCSLFVRSQRFLVFPCFANHKNIFTGCTFKYIIGNAAIIVQGTSYQFLCHFHYSSTVIRTYLNKNIQSNHTHIYYKCAANLYRINKKSVTILCNECKSHKKEFRFIMNLNSYITTMYSVLMTLLLPVPPAVP